jgi:hypothetical protein
MTVRAGYERLHTLLTGEPLKPAALPQLGQALSEQIKRGGRGSDIAAAKLAGVRLAEMVMDR